MSFLGIGFGAGAAVYKAKGVHFDNLEEIERGAGFTGAADSKLWTFSFWVKFSSVSDSGGHIFADVSRNQTRIQLTPVNGAIRFFANGTTGTEILNVEYLAGAILDNWTHVAFSIDLANSSNRSMYVNGSVVSPTWNTYSNNNIDFTETNWYLGDSDDIMTSGVDIAEVYHAPAQYLDLSANITKFIRGGKPVNLGPDGSRPTGTAPIMYCSARSNDDATAFATNRGTGGGMTVTGSLSLASTNPSD